jgi:hypothetical protein
MVDPVTALTITGTCISLIANIGKLSLQIKTFVSEVREARKDMDAVNRELSSLSLCLESLREDCTQIDYPENSRIPLVAILRNCDNITKEMEALLQKMLPGNMARRTQWVMTGRDEMNKLRTGLETHKSAIEIALGTIEL